MTTPFDSVIEAIARRRYHNHRQDDHSSTVSNGLFNDLTSACTPLAEDVRAGSVNVWRNVQSPGDRRRKVDLFVGEPGPDGKADIRRLRIALENKSVLTAHRNRTNRFDDLQKVLSAIHATRPEALLVATVLIGLAERVLNVPDQIHPMYRDEKEEEFNKIVLPRLSSGDQALWTDFPRAVSVNSHSDPANSVALFRTLSTRPAGHTHVEGYDAVLLVPMMIDNVNPPSLPRPNALGIDVDSDYQQVLKQLCAAYTARWHM